MSSFVFDDTDDDDVMEEEEIELAPSPPLAVWQLIGGVAVPGGCDDDADDDDDDDDVDDDDDDDDADDDDDDDDDDADDEMNDDGATAQDCGFILPTSYVVAPKKSLWPAVGRLIAVMWDAGGWDVGTVSKVYTAATTTTRNKRDFELAVVTRPPPSSSSSSRKTSGRKAFLEYSDWVVRWEAYVEPAPSDRTRYEPGSWCILTMCAGVPPPLPPPPLPPPLQTAVRRHFGGHGWYDGRIDEVRIVNPAVEWAIDGPWMAHVRWSDGERVWYDALAVVHMMACAQAVRGHHVPPQTPTLPPPTPAPPTPPAALPPPPAPTIVDAAQAAEAPPPPGDALPGVPADILALAPMMEESIRAQLRELRANCLTRILAEPEFML